MSIHQSIMQPLRRRYFPLSSLWQSHGCLSSLLSCTARHSLASIPQHGIALKVLDISSTLNSLVEQKSSFSLRKIFVTMFLKEGVGVTRHDDVKERRQQMILKSNGH
jgi:hypothetical protein